MSSAILVEFFNHNTWANLRLLAACAALTEAQLDVVLPGTYGSIRNTLVHLIGAEERYLRLLGHPADDILTHGAAYPGLADLERRVRRRHDSDRRAQWRGLHPAAADRAAASHQPRHRAPRAHQHDADAGGRRSARRGWLELRRGGPAELGLIKTAP